jgi:hypothetical protein
MYTDPGSGLLFAQILTAGFLAGVFRFRKFFAELLGRLRSRALH